MQKGKGEVNVSLFADDIIIQVENPKESKKKQLLNLMNKFRKITEYKVKMKAHISIYQ